MITIDGLHDVQNLMKTVAPKHAKNLMRSTIHGIAGVGAKEAKKRVPTRTGNLKKAIKAKRRKSPPHAPVSDVIVTQGKKAKQDGFYWRFVEYGTVHVSAQPFIGPTYDYLRMNYTRLVQEQFAKKLESKMRREAKKRANK